MPTDPWTAFDKLVMGFNAKLTDEEAEALNAQFSLEKILTIGGFTPVAADLAAGNIDKFKVGDVIQTKTRSGVDVDYIIIGKNADAENTLTVQTKYAYTRMRFCKPSEEHPYGWSHPLHNEMRPWLRDKFAATLTKDDLACIQTVKKVTRTSDEDGAELIITEDPFFLLSASEAGFNVDNEYVYDEGSPYEYYELNHNALRAKTDSSGNPRYWWLRSPNPSLANYVRYVNTDGSLYYYYAINLGFAVAPACVIKAKPIS